MASAVDKLLNELLSSDDEEGHDLQTSRVEPKTYASPGAGVPPAAPPPTHLSPAVHTELSSAAVVEQLSEPQGSAVHWQAPIAPPSDAHVPVPGATSSLAQQPAAGISQEESASHAPSAQPHEFPAHNVDLFSGAEDSMLPASLGPDLPNSSVDYHTEPVPPATDFEDLFDGMVLSGATSAPRTARADSRETNAAAAAAASIPAPRGDPQPAEAEPALDGLVPELLGIQADDKAEGVLQPLGSFDLLSEAPGQLLSPAASGSVQLVANPSAADALGATDTQPAAAADLLASASSGGLSDISTEEGAEAEAELLPHLADEPMGQHYQQPTQQDATPPPLDHGSATMAGAVLVTALDQSESTVTAQGGEDEEVPMPEAATVVRGSPAQLQPAYQLRTQQQEQQVHSHNQHQARQLSEQQQQAEEPAPEHAPLEQPLLEAAEQLEARLAAGSGPSRRNTSGSTTAEDAAYREDLLLAGIISQLESLAASGREDARTGGGAQGTSDGTILGRLAAARAFLSPSFEQLFRGPQPAGPPCTVAKYLGIVAVGTSSGATFVLLPGTPAPPGSKHSQQPPRLLEVAEKVSQRDAVTALCMGQHSGSVLLLVGHASGAVKVWELKTQLAGGVHFSLTKSLSGMHATAVTAAALLDGSGSTTWALTADAHGRLMAHNLNRHLSVTASAISSFARGLTGGSTAGPSHLISLQQAAAAAAFDPGVVCSLLPLYGRASTAQPGPGSTPQQHFAPEAASSLLVPDVGHFLLVTCSRAVLICLLLTDGRLQMLHVFLPPNNTPADCSPYAAWQVANLQQTASSTTALLAVAWQSNISVYKTVVLQRQRAQGPPGSTTQPTTQPLPAPALLRSWALAPSSHERSADAPSIQGCCFLDSGPLVVLSSQGETATAVQVFRQDYLVRGTQPSPREDAEAVETLVLRDWVVGSQVLAASNSTFHQSISGFGDQVLLLNSQGVRVIQLLSWQQRLSALASPRQGLVAPLLAAVRIYQEARVHSLGQQQADSVAWPAAGHFAELPEVERQMLTILLAYIDQSMSSLQPGHQERSSEDGSCTKPEALYQELANTAISCCLLVRRSDALWSDVFPRFGRTSRHARGNAAPAAGPDPRTAFLQQLLPFILSNQLSSVAPEVMQALVEHCMAAGQAEQLEACVLKMDLLSLDLNQLIPLCIQHGLFAALLHIFTCALQDYQTPAALLLVAAAAAKEAEAVQDPSVAIVHSAPGSISSQAWAQELLQSREVLRLGYKLLVFIRSCLMGAHFPPGTGQATPEQQQRSKGQALAFLLYSTCHSVKECWQLWAEMAHSREAGAVELPGSLKDPHPSLRFLCQLDAVAVLDLLRQSLADWDALETDLVELAPQIQSQIAPGGATRTVAQAVVDAIVALLETGAFGTGIVPETSTAAETAALRFLAVHLASNRASVTGSVVLRIVQFLAEGQQRLAEAQQRATVHDMPSAEREAIFCDVIAAVGSSMNPADQQQAIFLARRAGFRQAEARVRHAQGAYADALACLAGDTRHPSAVFKYVRDVLAEPGLTQQQREAFVSAAMSEVPRLLDLDAEDTTELVLDCFPDKQRALLAQLTSQSDQRYAFLYLKSLVAIYRLEKGSHGAGTANSANLEAGRHAPTVSALLTDMSLANVYFGLLCQYEPQSALQFLQSLDTYGVDECLQLCVQYGIQDGAAFLLERRGDVDSALRIHIQRLDDANRLLVKAVINGQLDLAAAAITSASDVAKTQGVARLPGQPATPAYIRHQHSASLDASSNASAAAAIAALLDSGCVLAPEVHAARSALTSAISLCLRYSQDRVMHSTPSTNSAVTDTDTVVINNAMPKGSALEQLWFQVLHCYVALLRDLRQQQHLVEHVQQDYDLVRREHTHWQLQLLQELFSRFVEQVISSMAGQIPLRFIADAIMREYGGDHWGDFKGPLLGLLCACAAELSILKCANRVVATDGAHILAGGYRTCIGQVRTDSERHTLAVGAHDASATNHVGAIAASIQSLVQRGTLLGNEMLAKAGVPYDR